MYSIVHCSEQIMGTVQLFSAIVQSGSKPGYNPILDSEEQGDGKHWAQRAWLELQQMQSS